jgi:Domain of unknown function (DUF4337)
MAEEVDVDTDRLQEQIEERRRAAAGRGGASEPARGRPRWLDALAVSTALFAVFAAVAALESGNYANEALYRANQGVLLQTQAVDTWNEYQADSIKKYQQQGLATVLGHVGGTTDEIQAAQEEAVRRQQTQDQLRPQAEQLAQRTEQLNRESEELLAHHHRFAVAVTLFQVAIGLGAIAALLRLPPMWWVSLAAGVVGLLSLVNGFTLTV